MKQDNPAGRRFDPLSTGVFEPLHQPAGGPGMETTLEIPWREFWERAHGRSTWWRYLVPLAILLAVTLSLPSLEAGFYLDDYVMIGLIESWYGAEAPALNLYASFLDLPAAPWWTSPDAHFAFWRPLSSAVIRLSHQFFGRDAFFYHAQLLLWLVALVAVCGRLYQGLSPRVAAVALVLFAADEAHAFTSGVICNGHVVISVVPALLGLVAYLRWRKEGWRPGLGLALLGFAVGLLGGEMAFAVLAYPLAYELFGARGPRKERLLAITPVALLAAAYLLFYKAMGLGPGRMFVYLNPFEQPPFEFLAGLAMYLPLYLANLVAALPLTLLANPALSLPYVATGIVVPVALFWSWRKIRGRLAKPDHRALRWWVPGALGALLPAAMALPSERQLLVPAIGIAPLLAAFVVHAWKSWVRATARPHRRATAAAVLVLILAPHLGVAVWNRIDAQQATAQGTGRLEATAAMVARLVDEESCQLNQNMATPHRHDVVVLSGVDFVTTYYTPAVYEFRQGAGSISWSVLSGAPLEHRLTRSGPRTLVLEPVEGELLSSGGERIYRTPDERLSPGHTVRKGPSFTAEILTTNDRGLTRVAFRFERDLGDPLLVLIVHDESGWRRLEAPELGESLLLRRPSRS